MDLKLVLSLLKANQTQNLVINMDCDDWLLEDDEKTLQEVGCGSSVLVTH